MAEPELLPLARAIRKLFAEENEDGTFRYGPAEVHAIRALILLELVRREQLDPLTSPYRLELVLLFEGIGLNEHTDPLTVSAKVKRYFEKLNVHREVLPQVDRWLYQYRFTDDRMKALAETEQAFGRMMAQSGPPATRDEDASEDAPPDATQSLGGKLQI